MRIFLCAIWVVFLPASGAWAQASDSVQVEVLTRTTASWDASALPEYPGGQPEVTILRITIPPKAQLPVHEHPVINAGVLISGELTVVTDEETLHLKAGDTIVELVNKRHFGKNDGDEPAVILVFYAGAEGKPITVRK